MSQSYNAALLNQILSQYTNGDKIKSFNKLQKFIKNNPKDYTALYNYGFMCQELQKIDIAIECYKKVIAKKSDHWRSKFNLYVIYIERKNYLLALKLTDEVLILKPNYQPAQRDKALILNYLNKPDEGLKYVKLSIKQNPKDYLAFNTLGLILISLKQYQKAEKVFLEALKINNSYIPSYNNIGHCYKLINEQEKAITNFRKALDIDPKSHEALNNIANHYNEMGKYKQALDFYFKALEFDSNNSKIMSNIAIAYFNLNNDKAAEKYYVKSYSITPNDEIIQKAYSFHLLKQQRYKEAWSLFDGRLKIKEFSYKNSTVDNVKNMLWQNENLSKNDKILVIKEQGVGDEILYGSMYADLLKKYPQTLIEADKRLISIFDRSFNLNKKNIFFPYGYFSNNKKKLQDFDVVIYAGSLGKIFRNSLNDFPNLNYLHADPKKIKAIKSKIDQNKYNLKIGISWQSKRIQYGDDKSIDLSLLLPILKIRNISYFNLQYGSTKEEVNKFNDTKNVNIQTIDNLDLFNDFESIAGLLKNLDLYITVSNSTAHLAGALGVPTWLIKPKNHVTFFYWNQPSVQTPWYNSIKIFSSKSNYEETIKKIRTDLIKEFKLLN